MKCCEYHQIGLDKINGFITTASIRAGENLYDGRPFDYCPWCGAKIRNIKKKKEPSADALLFYSNYPRKDDRKKALVAFDNLTKANQKLALADDTAARYSDREKSYIPLPTTYIHGELWNDEIIKKSISEKASFPRRGDCNAWVSFASDLGLKPNTGELQPSFERRVINHIENQL